MQVSYELTNTEKNPRGNRHDLYTIKTPQTEDHVRFYWSDAGPAKYALRTGAARSTAHPESERGKVAAVARTAIDAAFEKWKGDKLSSSGSFEI